MGLAWAEQAADLDPVVKRLRRLQLIPKRSPQWLPDRSVAAVAANRRHVRTPRRLSTSFWLQEAPSRVNEWLLAGVDVGPKRT